MQSRMLVRGVQLTVSGLALVVLAGCPKHENLPTALDVVTAPVPSSFVISSLPPTPQGNYPYDLTWTTSDPSVVDRYRLYLVEGGFVPELLAEPTNNQYSVSLPVNAVGLHFGLSAVSTGGVESAMNVQEVPPVPAP